MPWPAAQDEEEGTLIDGRGQAVPAVGGWGACWNS